MLAIYVIAILGLLISIYAYYIEKKSLKSKDYKAVCDFNDKVSCTKVLGSKEGHIFKVSNSLLGIGFYLFIIILGILNKTNFIFYLAVLSIISSIYLAYVQYFKLKNFCLVCTVIYIVNVLLLILSFKII